MVNKIDLIDKKILSELDKNCRITETQLAKKVGRSREAVKYRIKQLEEKGIIIDYITSLNPNKLGYYMFKVYLKLENIPKEKEKFYKFLKTNKNIYWYCISDGAFDCVFAILSKEIIRYFDMINELLSQWEHLIISKVLGTMVDTRQYNKKFFLNEKKGTLAIFGGDIINNKMDTLDSKILNILANEARIPITELSRKVNSTIEIVRTRIKKLEKEGIILGYRISVDYNKLGLEYFKAIIYFRTLTRKEEMALFEWMKNHPQSLYYIRSLAPWEVEFEFVVENYLEFNKIINELREKFPKVIRNHEHLIIIHEEWLPGYKEFIKN
ncbi:winged helix-turn-helix transcriptional regulator [Candidatus Woesearchaeota archaeon]|nr:winged helix-turn-helix transcriptional regulator [Candidatus Woesearchaeota archaeon]